MDQRFKDLAGEAFDNYKMFEGMLTDKTREAVLVAIETIYRDTGNAQGDYESLRDAIERLCSDVKSDLDEQTLEEIFNGDLSPASTAAVNSAIAARSASTAATPGPT